MLFFVSIWVIVNLPHYLQDGIFFLGHTHKYCVKWLKGVIIIMLMGKGIAMKVMEPSSGLRAFFSSSVSGDIQKNKNIRMCNRKSNEISFLEKIGYKMENRGDDIGNSEKEL